MLSKIQITGTIRVETGMHIGTSDGFAAIGAIDSPVAKDPMTRLPYIPGSSLKGKIRSLVARTYNEDTKLPEKHDYQDSRVTRLFGTSKDKNNNNNPRASRLIFTDSLLENYEELMEMGAYSETEAKEENTINPLTAVADPRQIERVIRGAKFPLEIIYNVDNEEELIEDMKSLALGLRLIQYDYIGGHGSRGYGRISISNIDVDCVIGELEDSIVDECRRILGE